MRQVSRPFIKLFLTASIVFALFSCQKENEFQEDGEFKDQDVKFSTVDDTTSLWEYFDTNNASIEIKPFKKYVRDRKDYFSEEEKSFTEIDSLYKQLLDDVDSFESVQEKVLIEFEETGSGNNKYTLHIVNLSEYLIDAIVIDFSFYDVYKEYVGWNQFEFVEDIKPGATYSVKQSLYPADGGFLNDKHNTFYATSAVVKLSISEDESVESRISGNVYDLKLTEIPPYFGKGNGRSLHMFRY